MNQNTSRNISKSVQLKHTKEKLHEMGHDRSNKKTNLQVISLVLPLLSNNCCLALRVLH